MDPDVTEDPQSHEWETPEAILEALRDHPEWTEARRDELVERLVAGFERDQIQKAIRPRLADLNAADGEVVIRLVETYATPELLRALAEAVRAQPDLPPERAWEALALLEGEGVLDGFPDLAEYWDDLRDSISGDDSIEALVEQLESDPEGVWLALEGLKAIEPEVRAQIVEGLQELPLGPGLVEFLRLLAFSHEPGTRDAALGVLDQAPSEDRLLVGAWSSIAAEHDDPEVVARARRWLGKGAELVLVNPGELDRPTPRIVRSLVTALDDRGQGSIIVSSRLGTTRTTAAFLCDVERGIREVVGESAPESPEADALFEAFAQESGRELVEAEHELALSLLAGSLSLCGPETPPSVPYWLEAVVGPGLRARAVRPPFPGWDPSSLPFDDTPRGAEAVLAACPDWLDRSELTFEIAEEIALRQGDPTPDPRRDAGAYRYLFEHRLHARLELFRRMLLWMASFWEASGDDELGRSALALAWQLSDPQHAVPGHPFTVALTTRSLSAAQATLGTERDPRQDRKRTRGA